MGIKEEFEKVLKLVSSGYLKPRIDKVFPLKEAAEAQQRMVEGNLAQLRSLTNNKYP